MTIDIQPQALGVDTGIPVARRLVYGVMSVNERTGNVVLDRDDVGLGNVDNTSDAEKKSAFTGEIADGDAGFVTGGEAYGALALKADAADIPAPSTTKPKAPRAQASVGTENKWARGDHIHPSDSSKLSITGGYIDGTLSMTDNRITHLRDGSAATDAATVGQIPVAATETPAMDGTAAVGSGTKWAREDHVHPSDTSKLSLSGGTMSGDLYMERGAHVYGSDFPTLGNEYTIKDYVDGAVAGAVEQIPSATTTTPKMDGSSAVGTESAWARGDHVHPHDSSKLSLTGGTMSGAIAMGSNKITGLSNGTASSDAAAFGQIPVASSTTPAMDGTAAAGSGTTWARSDHVHPTDTSRMAASLKGAANGVAELNASGKVPTSQMPYSLTHETWTFTLSDGTTTTKEVTLWQ